MTILVSTNVLLRLAQPNYRQCQAATESITRTRPSGGTLYPEPSRERTQYRSSIGGTGGGQMPLALVPVKIVYTAFREGKLRGGSITGRRPGERASNRDGRVELNGAR